MTGRFNKGKVQLTVVEGEYNGKKTLSFLVKKRILKDNQWKDTEFFTITDLQDLLSIVVKIVGSYVKYSKIEAKPQQQAQQFQNEFEGDIIDGAI